MLIGTGAGPTQTAGKGRRKEEGHEPLAIELTPGSDDLKDDGAPRMPERVQHLERRNNVKEG
jgi:hypothetical protein